MLRILSHSCKDFWTLLFLTSLRILLSNPKCLRDLLQGPLCVLSAPFVLLRSPLPCIGRHPALAPLDRRCTAPLHGFLLKWLWSLLSYLVLPFSCCRPLSYLSLFGRICCPAAPWLPYLGKTDFRCLSRSESGHPLFLKPPVWADFSEYLPKNK